jgi:hypothetical protein
MKSILLLGLLVLMSCSYEPPVGECSVTNRALVRGQVVTLVDPFYIGSRWIVMSYSNTIWSSTCSSIIYGIQEVGFTDIKFINSNLILPIRGDE